MVIKLDERKFLEGWLVTTPPAQMLTCDLFAVTNFLVLTLSDEDLKNVANIICIVWT